MFVGGRLRPAVEAVGVANPVGTVHIDAAPLVAPLVLVDVLIGDPQDIQAEAGGPGASRAGGHTQDKGIRADQMRENCSDFTLSSRLLSDPRSLLPAITWGFSFS